MDSLARGTPGFIVIPPVLVALVLGTMAFEAIPVVWWSLAILVLLAFVTFFGLFFFRDPERTAGEGLLASAHGRVLDIVDEGDRTRISTFMGAMDVHVVRAPLEGRVVSMERSGRGFHRADTPEAGRNVRMELDLEGEAEPFSVVMVSGWFARRIVPYVDVGDQVARGARIGLIRFGSRVDVLVPKDAFRITVGPGHRVRAGSSSLGVRTDARS